MTFGMIIWHKNVESKMWNYTEHFYECILHINRYLGHIEISALVSSSLVVSTLFIAKEKLLDTHTWIISLIHICFLCMQASCDVVDLIKCCKSGAHVYSA